MTAEDAEHWLYSELSSIIHRRDREMKRYKNSSSPEPKKSVKWKLKRGITWDVVELQGEITEEMLKKYFDKVEE